MRQRAAEHQGACFIPQATLFALRAMKQEAQPGEVHRGPPRCVQVPTEPSRGLTERGVGEEGEWASIFGDKEQENEDQLRGGGVIAAVNASRRPGPRGGAAGAARRATTPDSRVLALRALARRSARAVGAYCPKDGRRAHPLRDPFQGCGPQTCVRALAARRSERGGSDEAGMCCGRRAGGGALRDGGYGGGVGRHQAMRPEERKTARS